MHNPFDTSTALQEGLSTSLATLHAILETGLFAAVPTKPEDVTLHNHGMWLLNMLQDHLVSLQARVDKLDSDRVAAMKEGR